jgi:GDPmannose 4,6-dehydratase
MIRDFIIMAFAEIGITLDFIGEGIDEKANIKSCSNPLYNLPIGKQLIGIHPRYFRPAEVELLIGDATKANTKLGWKPKYDLPMLVKEMMEEEIKYQTKKG